MNNINPYAPPGSEVDDIPVASTSTDIDRLRVSPAWKVKFYLIAKAGGPSMTRFKQLAFGERMKIGFNIFAFLFGPLYYVAKGMWRKGLLLFVACVAVLAVLSAVLELSGFGHAVSAALGYATGAVFAVRANVDFYKKMVLKDNGWW